MARVDDATQVEFREKPVVFNVKTLITEHWKLTYDAGLPFGERFDLAADPHEYTNLRDRAAVQPAQDDLLRRLLDLLIEIEDPLPARLAYA